MTTPNIGWSVDEAQAYALMGYVSGIATQVKTPVYIKAVLKETHARLTELFDLWMDERARQYPHSFMHVYEWPSQFQAYSQTVGHEEYRLWRHYLDETTASDAVATFQFKESEVPVPVNPILAAEGVKSGVHIFHWKATAMEYGAPITVEPKLARYLAYVINGAGGEHGEDQAAPGAERFPNGAKTVMFSKGPVHFTAGGDTTHLKFTTSFIEWWSTMAESHLQTDIMPGLLNDLVNTSKINRAVKVGVQNRRKTMNISAQAALNTRVFDEAAYMAVSDMADNAKNYIADAAMRRAKIK